ncbi:MAG: hypothetical protein JST30_02245 [Armatimonadetes bacterium]|nr:hypothetical protein [Armatimonadota bacterium]
MSEAHAEAHAGHAHHVVSEKVLKKTFGILTAMMLLTIFAARAPIDGPRLIPSMAPIFEQWSGFWALTNAIALGIAVFKAIWVIRFFMGAQYASNLVKLYVVGGFIGFSLLFILFFDYVGRAFEPVRGWERVPSSSFPRTQTDDAGVPFKQFPTAEAHGGGHSPEPTEGTAPSGH